MVALNHRGRVHAPGFSLIELLVCVAVIGLLAAMLLPALASAGNKSRGMSCLNNEKQLTLACLMYADDFNERWPFNLGSAEIKAAAARGQYPNWTSPVLSWELDEDNTNTTLLTRGGVGDYVSRNARVYQCPSDTVVSDLQGEVGWNRRVRSTSMNMMIGNPGEFTQGIGNVNNPHYRQFFKTLHIPRPAAIFMLIEEHPDSINDAYFLDKPDSHTWTDLPASWHNGGANLSFADGHVESHRWLFPSTKPPGRPDAARLPFYIPKPEQGDFNWLMERMSVEWIPDDYMTEPYRN